MNTFQEYFNKRFLFEEAPGGGIGAPGALPGGPGGAGSPPGGMPPPIGGGGGGGGMGGGPPPGMGGGPPGGGAPGGEPPPKNPLKINTLDVWETLKKIFGSETDEKSPDIPEKPNKLQHLNS